MYIRIAGIIDESIVDGPGIRFVIFTQGCKHKCPGCHNSTTHSFSGGAMVDIDDIMKKIIQNPLLDGITLSGGEPFEQPKAAAELAHKAKKAGLSVMTYTGYNIEDILNDSEKMKLLNETDILVDGKFDIKRKNILLKFRGSDNQRIIDVKKTLEMNKIVIAEEILEDGVGNLAM